MKTSIVIVAYEAGPALTRCLLSLESQDESALEVLVVNAGGQGPEIADVARMGSVRLVELGANLGFAAGSNAGAREASGDVLVFLNPDTVVAPGAIAQLGRALADPAVGIAMARLRLLGHPELLNSGGNVVHISGLAWAGGYGEPAAGLTEVREVAYPSGAAMAIRADLFRELGGFAEELFMYHEDLELGWRARLRGLRIVVDPCADVFHDYDFGRNPQKQYLLERNRLVFVFSAFSPRLLLLLAPVLVATDAAVCALALKEGWLRQKAGGWVWCVRNAATLRKRRRVTQALRRVPDRELARYLTPIVDPRMLSVPALVRAANPLLNAYWALVRRAL